MHVSQPEIQANAFFDFLDGLDPKVTARILGLGIVMGQRLKEGLEAEKEVTPADFLVDIDLLRELFLHTGVPKHVKAGGALNVAVTAMQLCLHLCDEEEYHGN